jgi:hypothetical protein
MTRTRTAPVAQAIGAALQGLFRVVLLLRRPRPIHAAGRVLRGRIEWLPGAVPAGIAWIDEPPAAPVPVVARLSRSVGLPPALPDIIGLAMRLDMDGRPADIEFASTGIGVPARFLLTAHLSPSTPTLGTLFPYRGARGPVLLCARTVSAPALPAGGDALSDALIRDGWRVRLYHATPLGKWHAFADVALRLHEDPTDDLRFDAVRNTLPGAGTYDWVRAVRQPTYRMVQRRS